MILVNEGGYSFTVAGGDRPNNVHPREVLMADFNADGLNDFFIADHGYDEDPFPGWSNQLLLWTSEGFDEASDRLLEDPTGFTHSAAAGDVDGDGDIDILVGNKAGEFMGGGHYFLLNDGTGHYVALKSTLFTDSDAVNTLSWGVKVREGSGFKTLNFFPSEGEGLGANAGVFLTKPVITLAK